MIRKANRIRLVFLYYLSWAVFGTVGLTLNLMSVVLMPIPARRATGTFIRGVIRRSFIAWSAWLNMVGVVKVTLRNFVRAELRPGTVYVANHPSLIDATIILAHLPDAVCIFKPALMRNPAIGPAAIMAGYVRGDSGLDLIKAAAKKVAAGQSLLVFPEGTRTEPGAGPGRMKPGFAVIAERARAPVRLMIVRTTPGLGARGRGFWPAPQVLPAGIEITLDREWPHEPGRSAGELAHVVEGRIHEALGLGVPAAH